MAQKKLARFAELGTLPNVLQFPANAAGKWGAFFKNEQPLILELACGKGEYAVGLGELQPRKNFIGVDLKGNRIWVGAKEALRRGLSNVAFLRIQIDQLREYFAAGEVQEIWITFPDPHLRKSKAKKRLTHPKFLRLYQSILGPGGIIHLKTDSPVLFQFTRKVLEMYRCTIHEEIEDLYSEKNIPAELKIRTHYEGLDIAGSRKVHYLKFSLPADLPGTESDLKLKQVLQDEE
jgi:tRNA (guanine-N7-)-methyltransferase